MYATQTDIENAYGSEALLLVADRDGDGSVDQPVLDDALASADATIDGYVNARYALPLAQTPQLLTDIAVDLVMYRLASQADLATEERRNRYDDAIKTLRGISKGEIRLGLDEPAESGTGKVHVESKDRRFTRGSMGRLT